MGSPGEEEGRLRERKAMAARGFRSGRCGGGFCGKQRREVFVVEGGAEESTLRVRGGKIVLMTAELGRGFDVGGRQMRLRGEDQRAFADRSLSEFRAALPWKRRAGILYSGRDSDSRFVGKPRPMSVAGYRQIARHEHELRPWYGRRLILISCGEVGGQKITTRWQCAAQWGAGAGSRGIKKDRAG
jgi:hypothetical protein